MRIRVAAMMMLMPTAALCAELSVRPNRWPEPPKNEQSNINQIKSKSVVDNPTTVSAPTLLNEETPVIVLPEVTTPVQLSSSDVNRIVCPTDIKDVVYSKEKGINVKITGKDAFIKFVLLKKPDGEKAYSVLPTEMFVVCGDDTFQLIAYPKRVPAQTIRLTSGKDKKIRANQELYAGLPFEKRIIRAIKDVYTENAPESYAVTRVDKKVGRFKEVDIVYRRSFDIEGEGLRVREYEMTLKAGLKQFKLNEKMFIKKDFADNPVAISLEKHILRPGDMSRLFIVEQNQEKAMTLRGADKNDQLPSIEQVTAPDQQQKHAPSAEGMGGVSER